MISALSRSAAACRFGRVVHRQESVVVFMEADLFPLQFLFDERVAVEPVGGMKGKEARHAHDDGPQNCVPNIEVVMGEAAPLVRQDAMVGVLRRKLGHPDAEGSALL